MTYGTNNKGEHFLLLTNNEVELLINGGEFYHVIFNKDRTCRITVNSKCKLTDK